MTKLSFSLVFIAEREDSDCGRIYFNCHSVDSRFRNSFTAPNGWRIELETCASLSSTFQIISLCARSGSYCSRVLPKADAVFFCEQILAALSEWANTCPCFAELPVSLSPEVAESLMNSLTDVEEQDEEFSVPLQFDTLVPPTLRLS